MLPAAEGETDSLLTTSVTIVVGSGLNLDSFVSLSQKLFSSFNFLWLRLHQTKRLVRAFHVLRAPRVGNPVGVLNRLH